ncbi:MAG: hypothetical protein BIP78_1665 [Candidatus Bipolaricaulis sibiricus]|uniref:Uncharacterized protein n=1 Tax=Bipolaricaulis sibiricus TaxID=2501609 RepID=A0A410FWH8_BIPS1|nr:MAG: hypothetical protein BIP78_1665 [Candidatus Bipolaricaulis sibiricus]
MLRSDRHLPPDRVPEDGIVGTGPSEIGSQFSVIRRRSGQPTAQ